MTEIHDEAVRTVLLLKRLFNSADKRRCGFLNSSDLCQCVNNWYRHHQIKHSHAVTRTQVASALGAHRITERECSVAFCEFVPFFCQKVGVISVFDMPLGLSEDVLEHAAMLGESADFRADKAARVIGELQQLNQCTLSMDKLHRHYAGSLTWKDTSDELHAASSDNISSLVMVVLMKADNNPLSSRVEEFVSSMLEGLKQPREVPLDLTTVTSPLQLFVATIVLTLCLIWPELHQEHNTVVEAVETVVYLPLHDQLLSKFQQEFSLDQHKLTQGLAPLGEQQLIALGVPQELLELPELISLPAEHLAAISMHHSPLKKASCIAAACGSLADLVQQSGSLKQLGADEMLPCLAAIAAAAQPPQLMAQLRLIEWAMLDQLSAESYGYYVALLSAALFQLVAQADPLEVQVATPTSQVPEPLTPLSPTTDDYTLGSSDNDSDSEMEFVHAPVKTRPLVNVPLQLPLQSLTTAGEHPAGQSAPRGVCSRNQLTGVPLPLVTPRTKHLQREQELRRVMGELQGKGGLPAVIETPRSQAAKACRFWDLAPQPGAADCGSAAADLDEQLVSRPHSRRAAAQSQGAARAMHVGLQHAEVSQELHSALRRAEEECEAVARITAAVKGWRVRREVAGCVDDQSLDDDLQEALQRVEWSVLQLSGAINVDWAAAQAVVECVLQAEDPVPESKRVAELEAIRLELSSELEENTEALLAMASDLDSAEVEKQELIDELEHVLTQQNAQATTELLMGSYVDQAVAVRMLCAGVVRARSLESLVKDCVRYWGQQCVLERLDHRVVLEEQLREALQQSEDAVEVAAAQMIEIEDGETESRKLGECCAALGEWVVQLCELQQEVPARLVEWIEGVDFSTIPKTSPLRTIRSKNNANESHL